jgi:hypothetical protein
LGQLLFGETKIDTLRGLQAILGYPLAPLSNGHSPHTKGYEGSNRLTCLLWNRQRRSSPRRIRTAMRPVPPATRPTTRRPRRLLPPWPRAAHPRTSSPRGQASTACRPLRGVPHRADGLQTANYWPVERRGEAHQTEIGIHDSISGSSRGTQQIAGLTSHDKSASPAAACEAPAYRSPKKLRIMSTTTTTPMM